MMLKNIGTSLRLLLVMTVFLGLVYPLGITAVSQLLFPWQANGSMLFNQGEKTGSLLIGQNFSSNRYFQGRPSAAGDQGYDAVSSGGSNLGPTSDKLLKTIEKNAADARENNGWPDEKPVPSDLVTASASGLDPHITAEAAVFQSARIAKIRNLPEEQILSLIEKYTERSFLGFLGETEVNVLQLNLALDQL